MKPIGRFTGFVLAVLATALGANPTRALAPPKPHVGTYAEEKLLAHKAGIALTPAELSDSQAAVPKDQDAAPIYAEIAAELERNPLTASQSDLLEGKALSPTATLADQEAARKALDEIKPLLALIHRAAALPGCRFRRDWSQGADMLFPEYARFRRLARILSAEAQLLSAQGRVHEAVATAALVLRMARHAASDPVLIAYLVAAAIDAIGNRVLCNLLQAHPDAATARQILGVLRTEPPLPPIYKVVNGEVVCSAVALNRMLGRKAPASAEAGAVPAGAVTGAMTPQVEDAMQATVLSSQRQAMAALRLPYPLARTRLSALATEMQKRAARKDPTAVLANILLPLYGTAASVEARCQARRAVLASATGAVLAAAGGRPFPPTLAGVRTDPFTGKPLIYQREGVGFVVYSRGESGKYNGGAGPGSGREAIFRLTGPAR